MAPCVPGGCDTSSCHRSVTAVSPPWHLCTAQGSVHGGTPTPLGGHRVLPACPGGEQELPEASARIHLGLIWKLPRPWQRSSRVSHGKGAGPAGSCGPGRFSQRIRSLGMQSSSQTGSWRGPGLAHPEFGALLPGQARPSVPIISEAAICISRHRSQRGSRFVQLEKGERRPPAPRGPGGLLPALGAGSSPAGRNSLQRRWEPGRALLASPDFFSRAGGSGSAGSGREERAASLAQGQHLGVPPPRRAGGGPASGAGRSPAPGSPGSLPCLLCTRGKGLGRERGVIPMEQRSQRGRARRG